MLYIGSQFSGQLIAVAVVLVCVAASLVALTARSRGGRGRSLSAVAVLGAAALVLAATAMPTTWPLVGGEGDLVLQPGRGGLSRLDEALRIGGSELILLIGNVGMYAVLGAAAFTALVLRQATGPASAVAAGLGSAALSVLVESWQYLALGRVAATDDVLLNTAGAVLGVAAAAGLAGVLGRGRVSARTGPPGP